MDSDTHTLEKIAEANTDAVLVLGSMNETLYMNRPARELLGNNQDTLASIKSQLCSIDKSTDIEFIGYNYEMFFLTAHVAKIDWGHKKAKWILLKNRTPQIKAIAEKNKMIEALELRKAEMELFAFIVLHDVRAPLLAIRSFIDCLEESITMGSLPMINQDMDLLKISAWTMESRIDELLEMGNMNYVHDSFERVDFCEVLNEALKHENTHLVAGAIDVQVVGEVLPIGYGNKNRLVQLFQTLISNACKFMGNQNQPIICVSHRIKGNQNIFSVTDNGVGIAEEHKNKIFDAFYKIHENTEGSGLGLSLAKTIVEMYKGQLCVESKGRGYGTTFSFTLPMALKMNEISRMSKEQQLKQEVASGKFSAL